MVIQSYVDEFLNCPGSETTINALFASAPHARLDDLAVGAEATRSVPLDEPVSDLRGSIDEFIQTFPEITQAFMSQRVPSQKPPEATEAPSAPSSPVKISLEMPVRRIAQVREADQEETSH